VTVRTVFQKLGGGLALLFMESESLLPCSQEHASRPYPEPTESCLYPTTLYL